MTFDFSKIMTSSNIGLLSDGLMVTLKMSVVAWILAFVLAIVWTLMRASGFKPFEWFVALFVEIQQNVPLLVHVLFWYFAVPPLLPEPVTDWLNQNNSEFILAFLALSVCFSAYMSEALRGGLRAISKTQYEAGRALGFGYLATMRFIIVPQALRLSVPPLTNYSLLLFKNTTIAMAIGVHELIYQTRKIENDTFQTFEIFAVATLIYLVISFIIMTAGTLMERWLAMKTR